MTQEIFEHRGRTPSALAFMARAFLPSPGLPADGSFPRIVERWAGLRIEPHHLAAFRRAIGPGTGEGALLRAEGSKPAPPAVAEPAITQSFQTPQTGGWGFGKLTGDYNGIHWWPWYARRFGFPSAGGGVQFGLSLEGDPRTALLGRWQESSSP